MSIDEAIAEQEGRIREIDRLMNEHTDRPAMLKGLAMSRQDAVAIIRELEGQRGTHTS